MDGQPYRIVVTGAPASGKTEFIQRAEQHPKLSSFLFFQELARLLLEQDPTYRQRWDQFHLEIYRRQIERENAAAGHSFLTDRGTLDAFAFHPNLLHQLKTSKEREYERYSHVIQLGSSALLGEEFFRADRIRTESIDQVLGLQRATQQIWSGHPGYCFIEAEVDYEAKYRKFEAEIEKIVDLSQNY
ncbi:MAG: AAA family ATPase [bacterium]|nr:AAA family ATPase [bacterium]